MLQFQHGIVPSYWFNKLVTHPPGRMVGMASQMITVGFSVDRNIIIAIAIAKKKSILYACMLFPSSASTPGQMLINAEASGGGCEQR